jgi:hypothetical protein
MVRQKQAPTRFLLVSRLQYHVFIAAMNNNPRSHQMRCYAKLVSTTGAIALFLMFITSAAYAQRPEPKKTELRGDTMYTLLKPGDIPAIFEPEFFTVSEADSFYFDQEPLIAVVSGEVARGYSTWHLDHHEVVNDVIEGTAIAVTW